MAFHWNWFSQMGATRDQNQDFAGIALGEDFLFAVIADGVFSREGSGELASQLVKSLVDRAMDGDHLPTGTEVTKWVADSFRNLAKIQTPKTSASFLAAGFRQNQLLFAVHAGDCRIGVHKEIDGPIWKTAVHSLATATKPLSEVELIAHPLRNQLTRAFNSKRLCEPDITELKCAYPEGAALVTDGFWAGLSNEAQRTNFAGQWHAEAVCEDDVSSGSCQQRCRVKSCCFS